MWPPGIGVADGVADGVAVGVADGAVIVDAAEEGNEDEAVEEALMRGWAGCPVLSLSVTKI